MKDFVSALSAIKTEEEMQAFVQEIFTEKELSDFEKRWQLMKQLKEGKTQREIAKNLGISLCKVTRGNKIIKDEFSITNRLLDGDIDE